MKILLIRQEKELFAEKGKAYEELVECAKRVDEIHVIVHTLKADRLFFKKMTIDKDGGQSTIFLYPTDSSHKIFYIRDTVSLARFQLTNRFHLIVSLISAEEGFAAAVSAYIISWKYGKNFMMGVHQTTDEMTIKDNMFVRAAKKDLLAFLVKRASGIRVSSQDIGEEIYGNHPELADRIYILPFVADVERLREAWTQVDIHRAYPRFNIILLHAARQVSFDGIVKAKSVMKILRKRYPRIGLVVIGKIRHGLMYIPQRLFLPDCIVFGKRISDMTSYYRTANVFVDMSFITDSAEQDSELVNAALAGCPIVTARTASSDQIIRDGENGFVVNPSDSKLFAKKIIDILEQDGLRETMRFARFNISEIYGKSLDGYADRLTGIWESCKSEDEKNAHIDHVAAPLPQWRAKRSKAITMLVAERVKQKLARGPLRDRPIDLAPTEGENQYVVELDRIKATIEEVQKEAEKQPEPIAVFDNEIIDLDKEGTVRLR